MLNRQSLRRNLKTDGVRGQALVEFSLVILVFLTMFVGMLEFGFAFAVDMQTSFASRDAAIVASESGGSASTADCAILNTIDRDTMAPANRALIDHVDVFWATATGGVNNGAVQTYQIGGTLCVGWGGWSQTAGGYPAANRCAIVGGSSTGFCQASPNHTGPDRIGITVVYKYAWMTPLPSMVGLGGTGFTFSQTNYTTMEPVPTS
jgi:flavin-binding protein dodecin